MLLPLRTRGPRSLRPFWLAILPLVQNGGMAEGRIDPRTHIGAVTVKVSDLARSAAFYTGVLGMTRLSALDGRAKLGVEGRELLELIEVPGAKPRPRRSTGLYHFAVLTPDRAALGRSLAQLVEKKYPLTGASDHLVSEALYLDDPDRIGIEIYRDRLRSEWPMDGQEVRMGSEPVDLEELLELGARNSERGADGENSLPGAVASPSPSRASAQPGEAFTLGAATVMGHVHLHVRDLDEAERFYCGLLEFEVMQRWPPSALFISAGGYHHHIGLNTWAGVGAPPPPDDAAGLVHFEIVLPDDAAVAAVADRLRSGGVPVSDVERGFRTTDPSSNGILIIGA